jgi:hypothetical protein
MLAIERGRDFARERHNVTGLVFHRDDDGDLNRYGRALDQERQCLCGLSAGPYTGRER